MVTCTIFGESDEKSVRFLIILFVGIYFNYLMIVSQNPNNNKAQVKYTDKQAFRNMFPGILYVEIISFYLVDVRFRSGSEPVDSC